MSSPSAPKPTQDDYDMTETQLSATQATGGRAGGSNDTIGRSMSDVADPLDDLTGYRNAWMMTDWEDSMLESIAQVAKDGFTSSSDWSTLQPAIKLQLLRNLVQFLALPSHRQAVSEESSSSSSGLKQADSFATDDGGLHVPGTGVKLVYNQAGDQDMRPSTNGGLVLPPFPPLRKRKVGESRPISPSFPISNPPHVPGSAPTPQQQQQLQQQQQQMMMMVQDPLYDEEAAIGGKVLPAFVGKKDGETLLEGVWKLLEEFDTSPPFTIQRLCELAVHPFEQHKSVGKYLRAVERVLLVTSSFDPNASIGSIDPSTLIAPGTGNPGVPAGLALERPLFAPIPFLQDDDSLMAVRPPMQSADIDVEKDDGMKQEDEGWKGGSKTGGLTPLALAPTAVAALAESSSMSPTSSDSTSKTETIEPFLGRVDELDAGPLLPSHLDPNDPHQLHSANGQAGNTVVAHGVSDRPQAISSTTDLSAYREGNGNKAEESESESDAGDDQSVASDTSTSSSKRRISRLPRTVSTQSLRDRFVSTGLEVLDPAKEEDRRFDEPLGTRLHQGQVKREDRADQAHGIKVGDSTKDEAEGQVSKARKTE